MSALADWREAHPYPPVDGTLMARWHWEFLRRNPQYQADYERFLALDAAQTDERDALARRYGLEGIMLDYREALEALFETPRRSGQVRMIQWQTDWVGADSRGRLIEGLREDTEYLDPRIRQHECCVVLNLRDALAPQIDTARERLHKLQQHYAEKRGDVMRYPHYLRLVDAWDDGATEAEMGEVLLPHEMAREAVKLIREDLKEAQRLRDVDYRFI